MTNPTPTLAELIEALKVSTDLLDRAAQHVPYKAVNASMALTRPIAECRTVEHIEAQVAANRALLSRQEDDPEPSKFYTSPNSGTVISETWKAWEERRLSHLSAPGGEKEKDLL